jgi:hypothetical protein
MTGTYHSPPFIDPQDWAKGLVGDTPGKRDILVCNLLTNVVEAGDISFDSPTTALRSIHFPEITLNCVRKVVLGARNTTLVSRMPIPVPGRRNGWIAKRREF